MSYKRIEMFEFDCDGHCGAKATASARPGISTYDLPKGWATLSLSPEAHKAIGSTEGEHRHFCPTCIALMTLPLWNRERQFKILSLLSEDELDDYNLDGLFERLQAAEKKRLQQEMKVGHGG